MLEQGSGCGKGMASLLSSRAFMPIQHAEILYLFRLVKPAELQVGHAAFNFLPYKYTRITYLVFSSHQNSKFLQKVSASYCLLLLLVSLL